METAKRTYALPSQTLKRFEGKIGPGKRSAKIAELMETWIRDQERAALRERIIEGCHEMNEINREIAKEWEAADDELWRSLDS